MDKDKIIAELNNGNLAVLDNNSSWIDQEWAPEVFSTLLRPSKSFYEKYSRIERT